MIAAGRHSDSTLLLGNSPKKRKSEFSANFCDPGLSPDRSRNQGHRVIPENIDHFDRNYIAAGFRVRVARGGKVELTILASAEAFHSLSKM